MGKEELIEMLSELFQDNTIEIIPHVRSVGPNGGSTQVDIEVRVQGETVLYERG